MMFIASLGHYLFWGHGVVTFDPYVGGHAIRCVRRSRTGIPYVKWLGAVLPLANARNVVWLTPPLKRNEEVGR